MSETTTEIIANISIKTAAETAARIAEIAGSCNAELILAVVTTAIATLSFITAIISLKKTNTSIKIAQESLDKTTEALNVSIQATHLALEDSYNNRLTKLLAFARMSLHKLEEMEKENQNGAQHTREDFYKKSMILENFETYHIAPYIFWQDRSLNSFAEKKIQLIKKVRQYIFDSRNDFRLAKQNPNNQNQNTVINASDVMNMEKSLNDIRDYIIQNS